MALSIRPAIDRNSRNLSSTAPCSQVAAWRTLLSCSSVTWSMAAFFNCCSAVNAIAAIKKAISNEMLTANCSRIERQENFIGPALSSVHSVDGYLLSYRIISILHWPFSLLTFACFVRRYQGNGLAYFFGICMRRAKCVSQPEWCQRIGSQPTTQACVSQADSLPRRHCPQVAIAGWDVL